MTYDPSPFTLRSAAGLSVAPPAMSESVLVVIDAQLEYSAAGALPLDGTETAVENIASLIKLARSSAAPVIHLAHLGKTGGLFDPKRGGAFFDLAAPTTGELVIKKSLPNCFADTALASELASLGERPLVLAGFMTHMCVSSTARAALDLGIEATVVSDATATRSLPIPGREGIVPAAIVHESALAALADRFSNVVDTSQILSASLRPRRG